MTRQIISTVKAPRPPAPISQAVRTGHLVYVSGITPFTLDLQLAKGDCAPACRFGGSSDDKAMRERPGEP